MWVRGREGPVVGLEGGRGVRDVGWDAGSGSAVLIGISLVGCVDGLGGVGGGVGWGRWC